jgi:uridine monophosphate synthetase
MLAARGMKISVIVSANLDYSLCVRILSISRTACKVCIRTVVCGADDMVLSSSMDRAFFSLLERSVQQKDSLLCVGIDPQGGIYGENVYETLVRFGERIISQTEYYAACFKPNIAFYEAFGAEGARALKKTIELVPETTPVILDAKRSDIGNTAKAYADCIFGHYRADATTLNPYLGKEAVLPFLQWEGKGLFILCRTSNPGSGLFQEMPTGRSGSASIPYFLRVAEVVSGWSENVGLVVAGNLPRALSEVRELLPEIWILAPGVGIQGGVVEDAIRGGLRRDGKGILLSVSRTIACAESSEEAARKLRDEIRRAAGREILRGSRRRRLAQKDKAAVPKTERGLREELEQGLIEEKRSLIGELIRAGCFRLGEFKLKSGRISPFYIDLRMIVSAPSLLSRVASAYASLLKNLSYVRLAGIPFAGVPLATAVSLLLKVPMIFPRLERKGHGIERRIEGGFERGDRVVLLDDLITSGASKIEAIDILRGEGLIVEDLVVLIERGRQGREELRREGVRLRSFLGVEEFLDVCQEMELIDSSQRQRIEAFLAEG